jgi:DNA-binding MarR family transcriptional regulator
MKRSAARERVTAAEYEALAAFRAALRGFLAFSEAAARAAGLTPRQHQALLAVQANGGREPTVGALAESLGLRHHSTVGLVDRLVALGLLARAGAAADRRRVELVLTPRGKRRLEALTTAHRRELRQVAPQLKALVATLEAGPHGRAGRRRP